MKALFLSFLLFAVTLTGIGLGHARGVMPAEEAIVICQGHGSSVIWIDAEGKEVERQLLCAEAALALLAGTGPAAPDLSAPNRDFSTLLGDLVGERRGALASLSPSARGPPLSV